MYVALLTMLINIKYSLPISSIYDIMIFTETELMPDINNSELGLVFKYLD